MSFLGFGVAFGDKRGPSSAPVMRSSVDAESAIVNNLGIEGCFRMAKHISHFRVRVRRVGWFAQVERKEKKREKRIERFLIHIWRRHVSASRFV